ncbi:Nif3-like dinuclear metal center hexameric protein [Nitrogeniibacter mangrovi]|uniref:Nif3-like dinuclear metal center hexameric protein n=1 Tax=Nitrogeniibacter mangrovi TaxID=2016596 RepID=A0A6C1B919_9RHOO|nr:Nif3-like dinuclear metal center hexameric protein [Nitrogeniibacter mangrovi]QID19873.1 Nif3-like dinuclear metal center hexameric protein [Nitrogeniibacter mangrovi]
MELTALTRYVDELLNVTAFRDYCPNGLQVEGRAQVRTIVSGVTASFDLIEAAIALGADAVLVHHGYFWRGEDARVVGIKRRRLARLLAADLSLLGYHLPLDVHPELGNNAQLAKRMGWVPEGTFGDDSLGVHGRPATAGGCVQDVADALARTLGRAPLVVGDAGRPVARIGWCTGAAQGYLDAAIAAGCDVFVSGEVSEPTVHLARESGVAYISAGHHATERYGIQALGEHLAARFDLEHHFVDIDNPV